MTTTQSKKYRGGTGNGPGQCIHGKTTKTDNCRECWEARGWKDLRWDDELKKSVVAVLPDGTVV
jgi:hypothetical protein